MNNEQSSEKRRFTRVIFSRTARLICGDRPALEGEVHDLSIGGLFLTGQYDVQPEQTCELALHETGRHSCLILKFQVKVTRVDSHGLALQFLDMTPDCYNFLQTMVLYSTEDPLGVALEFLEDFPAVSSSFC